RGAVPRNRGAVTTLLAGVSLTGMSPAMTVEGGTDTAVFATYLEHFLLLSLSPGTVIVVDNVGAHQPDRIRELVTAAGCPWLLLVVDPVQSLGLPLRAVAVGGATALDGAEQPVAHRGVHPPLGQALLGHRQQATQHQFGDRHGAQARPVQLRVDAVPGALRE